MEAGKPLTNVISGKSAAPSGGTVDGAPASKKRRSPRLPAIVAALEKTVIPHPALDDALNSIEALHSRAGQGLQAHAALILGERGAGKTTLLDTYLNRYPVILANDYHANSLVPEIIECLSDKQRRILKTADLKRVIKIELKSKPTARSVAADLVRGFGLSPLPKWTESDMLTMLPSYAEEMGTELFLIDEAHHIVMNKDEATEEVSEYFKSLLNKVKAQIVLSGLPSLVELRKYSQFKRRLEPDICLEPYDWATVPVRVAFSTLLAYFETFLGLPEASGLASHEFAKRMYVATEGEVGIVSKHLSRALKLAIDRKAPRLSLNLMAEVYEDFQDSADVKLEMIDFDQIIDVKKEAEEIARKQAIDNPFLCDNARLREIWTMNVANRSLNSRAKIKERDLRAVASGRRPYTPFKKS